MGWAGAIIRYTATQLPNQLPNQLPFQLPAQLLTQLPIPLHSIALHSNPEMGDVGVIMVGGTTWVFPGRQLWRGPGEGTPEAHSANAWFGTRGWQSRVTGTKIFKDEHRSWALAHNLARQSL